MKLQLSIPTCMSFSMSWNLCGTLLSSFASCSNALTAASTSPRPRCAATKLPSEEEEEGKMPLSFSSAATASLLSWSPEAE